MPNNDGKLTPKEIAESLLDPKSHEEKKKKIELAKKAKAKKEEDQKKTAVKPKELKYYDVRIECLLPGTLTYRVLAEDAVQAAELIKNRSPNSVVYNLIGVKNIILRVYDSGSNMMRWMRRF